MKESYIIRVIIILFVTITTLSLMTGAIGGNVMPKKEDYSDSIAITLKLLNGKKLPTYLNGATEDSEASKYVFIEIKNLANSSGVFVIFDVFSPNNPNLFVNDIKSARIPDGSKAFLLLYADHPAMSTPDDKVELKYRIKKIMFK